MNKSVLLFLLSLLSFQIQAQTETVEEKKQRQDAIIQEHVYDGADKINTLVMMKEYQEYLDAGLEKDSTIAYIWQQKAMPYYKAKKYSVGKPFLDNAVKYDEKRWLSYRGFMKCIFSKDYVGAIEDMQNYISKYGNQYEMDHTCAFYVGLSYLQLNEFEKAEAVFKTDIEEQITDRGEAHFLDWFYYGITLYELHKFDEAITCFDETLQEYSSFAEAQYYKAMAMFRSGKDRIEAQMIYDEALQNGKDGYTINDTNAIYETYPYQIRWKR